MTKIFISAYACEPGLGSEIGVGWHWVLELSKYYDLWVLTRKSNQHTIKPWIEKHPEYKNIHWLYFDLPKWARFWKKGLRGVRTYYNIWQMLTNRLVKRTMQEQSIKVFLHVTYGNALLNMGSYGQKQFFIWGPIGGLETIGADYSKHYATKWQLIEAIRRFTVKMTPLNFGFKGRCRNADIILAKTEITRQHIPEQYRDKAILQTDVATEKIDAVQINHAPNSRLELITVGRLDAWRGFDLCIEALRQTKSSGINAHLRIVGKGSDQQRLQNLVEKCGLYDDVTFIGQVPMEKYKEMMVQSDIILNASLKEGAVTVSFDAMALGKPMICLDTTGYTRYFNDDYAVVLPIRDRDTVIKDIAQAIVRLNNSDLRLKMGMKAMEAASMFTWEVRGKEVYNFINPKINAFLQNNKC